MSEGADLQATAWMAEKQAREFVQRIEARMLHGATMELGNLSFDRNLQMIRTRKVEQKA